MGPVTQPAKTLTALLALAAFAAALLTLTGCEGTKLAEPLRPFVETSVQAATVTLGPDLEAYYNADPNLTPEQLGFRLELLEQWRSAANSAQHYLDE